MRLTLVLGPALATKAVHTTHQVHVAFFLARPWHLVSPADVLPADPVCQRSDIFNITVNNIVTTAAFKEFLHVRRRDAMGRKTC